MLVSSLANVEVGHKIFTYVFISSVVSYNYYHFIFNEMRNKIHHRIVHITEHFLEFLISK